jgi:hypothetical protein
MFEVVELGGLKTTTSENACNHVYIVDVSGSMYYSLPTIRDNLKNIIGLVAKPNDTFSVIWFSGRGQAGTLFSNVLVSDKSTVAMMHNAIDRYLVPVGLTGFVDPMRISLDLQLDPSKTNNLVMMTDGYDNTSSRSEIMKFTGMLKEKFSSVTFMEYGYYADRDLLAKMTEAVGGTHIFADTIERYTKEVESVFSGAVRVSNVTVDVNKRAKHCVYVYNGQIRIVEVEDGTVQVPADTDKVYSIVPSDVLSKQLSDDHVYLVMYYAIKQSNDKLVWDCLQRLGDTAVARAYENAFTKQELSAVEDLVKDCVLDSANRYQQGKSNIATPNKDTKTVVDLLNFLVVSNAELLADSPEWSYNRTTKGSESTSEENLPRFVRSKLNTTIALRGLVFNSSRPNISIGVTQQGVVMLPENDFGLKSVPSHVHRNYTIIRDGIKNVEKIPVKIAKPIDQDAMDCFDYHILEEDDTAAYVVFNLASTPVVNRLKVQGLTVQQFAENAVSLEFYKAALKVVNSLIAEQGGSDAKIEGLKSKYGEEAAAWLSSIGVRDYGFSPVGTKTAEATDEYQTVEVDIKFKGLSSLPKLDDVRAKVKAGKATTVSVKLMAEMLDRYSGMEKDQLEAVKSSLTTYKRAAEVALADKVYACVLGRVWWGDEETIAVDVNLTDDIATTMTIGKVRKTVKI